MKLAKASIQKLFDELYSVRVILSNPIAPGPYIPLIPEIEDDETQTVSTAATIET